MHEADDVQYVSESLQKKIKDRHTKSFDTTAKHGAVMQSKLVSPSLKKNLSVERKRELITDRLTRIMERMAFDRPILLKDKLDVIHNPYSEHAEKDLIQYEIFKRKVRRQKLNHHMADQYSRMMDFVEDRFSSQIDDHYRHATRKVLKEEI